MTREMTLTEMMADLSATFPTLWKRPLSEFSKQTANLGGIWTGADTPHVMHDGEPIFSNLHADLEAPYTTGPVHDGFVNWLANRGWVCDCYDPCTFWLLPLSATTELDGAPA